MENRQKSFCGASKRSMVSCSCSLRLMRRITKNGTYIFVVYVPAAIPLTNEPIAESQEKLRVLFIASNPPGTIINHCGVAQQQMTELLTGWTEFKAVPETTWDQFQKAVSS